MGCSKYKSPATGFHFPKYLSSRPLKALPWRASPFDGMLADGNSVVPVLVGGREYLKAGAFQLCNLLGVVAFEILNVEHHLQDVHVVTFVLCKLFSSLLCIDNHLAQYAGRHCPNISLVQVVERQLCLLFHLFSIHNVWYDVWKSAAKVHIFRASHIIHPL